MCIFILSFDIVGMGQNPVYDMIMILKTRELEIFQSFMELSLFLEARLFPLSGVDVEQVGPLVTQRCQKRIDLSAASGRKRH
jgi:hypothetical protein